MKKKESSASPTARVKGRNSRLTMMLRSDLTERVKKLVPALQQNPNSFVNLCVEGCLDAMEADAIAFQIPIVRLHRIVHRKPFLDADRVPALLSIFAPFSEKLTPGHLRCLATLINGHDGTLSAAAIRFYWVKAIEMEAAGLQTEQEIKAMRASRK